MRTDRAQANGEPPGPPAAQRRGWFRRLRTWLPFLVKPLRRGVVIFILLLVIEYLVVPELVGASKDLYLLGQVNPLWLVGGARRRAQQESRDEEAMKEESGLHVPGRPLPNFLRLSKQCGRGASGAYETLVLWIFFRDGSTIETT